MPPSVFFSDLLSPSFTTEITIPEQGVDNDVGRVYLLLQEGIYGSHTFFHTDHIQQLRVVGLESGCMRGYNLVETYDFIYHVAVAALVVQRLDGFGHLPYLQVPYGLIVLGLELVYLEVG